VADTSRTIDDPPVDPGDTRERILDIALDLFTSQGYDKTSLRQIAERLGFSKAAIYYHFASKGDILMALHLRMHEFIRDTLATVEERRETPAAWAQMLDHLIDVVLRHRSLFIFHERNQAAIEELHRSHHEIDHEDLQARLRALVADGAIPLETRVRMTCAFGAVMGGLMFAGDVFAGVPDDQLSGMLRGAVSDLLGSGAGPTSSATG
jgi:AcrR family transcriptional regulator